MKLKMPLSLSPMEKFLHIVESNEDLEVTFDKNVTSETRMVTIYVEREDKYILKRRSEDGEAEMEKRRWRG